MKDEGRSRERRERGITRLGEWRIGKGAKGKWEREEEGVMGLESMHKLAGNGWSG